MKSQNADDNLRNIDNLSILWAIEKHRLMSADRPAEKGSGDREGVYSYIYRQE